MMSFGCVQPASAANAISRDANKIDFFMTFSNETCIEWETTTFGIGAAAGLCLALAGRKYRRTVCACSSLAQAIASGIFPESVCI